MIHQRGKQAISPLPPFALPASRISVPHVRSTCTSSRTIPRTYSQTISRTYSQTISRTPSHQTAPRCCISLRPALKQGDMFRSWA
ncbi:uncharacterized protein M421DRAFT_292812 [Didymella exigua CBS 183.55]|uniref:Uncharacterized protein n=1 Tax=Didymella exigua CBS 183.55 TaxID=1150837 RepID=A0A6A5S1U9_9PLEO|nr:uncharacterized protein M421DRAFT_292812 [Didymella exigua CBS 183.55]KAF1932466.1 hypothetical protein M421DRAFT_292812 [Didymella exigua CBS 183.55]